jgi:hypothetical protein
MSVSFPEANVVHAVLQVNQALLKEDDDLLRQTFLSVFREHHPQVSRRQQRRRVHSRSCLCSAFSSTHWKASLMLQLANKVDVIFALSQVGHPA